MNPALTADEAGYQQSNSGGAVVVVDDASAQVLAGPARGIRTSTTSR